MDINKFLQEKINDKIKNLSAKELIEIDRSNFPNVIIKKNNKKIKAVSFACNDYLGLSVNKSVKNAMIKSIKNSNIGSGGSKFIGGYCKEARLLEEKIARYKKFENCTLFSSGYLANIGVFSSIFNENDIIFADKQVHASIIDGIAISKAKLVRYNHLDHNHLKSLISKYKNPNNSSYLKTKFAVVSESVFSMSGDVENLQELYKIATNNNMFCIIDDAHGLGVVLKNNITQDINNKDLYIQIGTLSKSVGLVGGYVCGSSTLIKYINNYARTGIYNTFLSKNIIVGALKAFEIISLNLLNSPVENAKYFVKIINEKFKIKSQEFLIANITNSAIVCINFTDITKSLDKDCKNDTILHKNIAKYLLEKGFFVRAILPPTSQKAMIRFTFSSLHNINQINLLTESIATFFNNICLL